MKYLKHHLLFPPSLVGGPFSVGSPFPCRVSRSPVGGPSLIGGLCSLILLLSIPAGWSPHPCCWPSFHLLFVLLSSIGSPPSRAFFAACQFNDGWPCSKLPECRFNQQQGSLRLRKARRSERAERRASRSKNIQRIMETATLAAQNAHESDVKERHCQRQLNSFLSSSSSVVLISCCPPRDLGSRTALEALGRRWWWWYQVHAIIFFLSFRIVSLTLCFRLPCAYFFSLS